MIRVVAAAKYDEVAVQGSNLGTHQILDTVCALEKAQAATAGIRPGFIEIEQGRCDLRLAVGMDGAMTLVQCAANRNQGWQPAERGNAEPIADRIRNRR